MNIVDLYIDGKLIVIARCQANDKYEVMVRVKGWLRVFDIENHHVCVIWTGYNEMISYELENGKLILFDRVEHNKTA